MAQSAGDQLWQGVRMRQIEAAGEPDQPVRLVSLPVTWGDDAAAALAALVEGSRDGQEPISLTDAAEGWIGRVAAAATTRGISEPVGERLRALLLARRGAPDRALWSHATPGADDVPGFVLNLAGFFDPVLGLDVDALAEAIDAAVLALGLAAPAARRISVAMSDLAGLLAALGLEYDSAPARLVAANLAALLRGRADAASARFAAQATLISPDWRLPPPCPELPELAVAARAARGVLAPHHDSTTAILPPGPADALLGVETGGIAPAFSPLTDDGRLTGAARAWLAACDLSPETALARQMAGEQIFPVASPAAHRAMREAVAGCIPVQPELPELRSVARTERRELPARRRGYTQQASVGGHRILLSTAEFADGTLGEIAIRLPKESATVRGLMEGLAHAVSIGLQHGVALDEFVEAFSHTRFAPSGAVGGDAAVGRASSLLDYVVRHLAANYAPRIQIAEPATEATAPTATPPSLPLDLPAAPRQRVLRVVSANG